MSGVCLKTAIMVLNSAGAVEYTWPRRSSLDGLRDAVHAGLRPAGPRAFLELDFGRLAGWANEAHLMIH